MSIRVRTRMRACIYWEMGLYNITSMINNIAPLSQNVLFKDSTAFFDGTSNLESAKALNWVRIQAAFYSKGLFFPIVKLLTSKSALQDSVYGSTAGGNKLNTIYFWIILICFDVDAQLLQLPSVLVRRKGTVLCKGSAVQIYLLQNMFISPAFAPLEVV